MGDMADLALEQMYDAWADEDEDAWQRDDSIWFPRTVACHHCGKSGLRWSVVNSRWLLYDTKGVHTCKSGIDIDVMESTCNSLATRHTCDHRRSEVCMTTCDMCGQFSKPMRKWALTLREESLPNFHTLDVLDVCEACRVKLIDRLNEAMQACRVSSLREAIRGLTPDQVVQVESYIAQREAKA